MKEFRRDGKRIETRFFVRHQEAGWAGYTYQWKDDQSDAVLLPSGKTITHEGSRWAIPSRGQCLSCHTEAAGRVLGFDLRQLQTAYTYPNGATSPQVKTLARVDLFGNLPDKMPTPYASLASDAPAKKKALSYLAANCAHCHQPETSTPTEIDLRFAPHQDSLSFCGEEPTAGDLGVSGAKVLAPGAPKKSVLALRMETRDVHGMPPLATFEVHEEAVEVVSEWISQVSGCGG